jgi:hypothetical protein
MHGFSQKQYHQLPPIFGNIIFWRIKETKKQSHELQRLRQQTTCQSYSFFMQRKHLDLDQRNLLCTDRTQAPATDVLQEQRFLSYGIYWI